MSKKQMCMRWGSGSPPCWKAMIVVAEKGIEEKCENMLLEFSKKEHKSEEVLKLNPRGQLPTFTDEKIGVNESGAICMYLENFYSNDKNRLIPTDKATAALCYQRMFETANVQSNAMPLLIYKMFTPAEKHTQADVDAKVAEAKKELALWESHLEGKKYLAGDNFSMADVFFYIFIAVIVRQGGKLAEFPNLRKYHDLVSERPSVKSTRPTHWKDSPSPNNLKEL